MKKRIAIYGGTDLSAAESWFVVSLTLSLLKQGDLVIITGGFLCSKHLPGAISTDFSVLQGATQYAKENDKELKECLETWLPDEEAENDPEKKDVERFKKGAVKKLIGESAYIRRFSMVKYVDAIITVKGKKHTKTILEFAFSLRKPAFPLSFTGGDSFDFWNSRKEQIIKTFEISDDFLRELEVEKIEAITPVGKNKIKDKLVKVLLRSIENEAVKRENYKQIQRGWGFDHEQDEALITELQGRMQLDAARSVAFKKIRVFLSYSHKDEKLREQLDKHLTALKRSNQISVWFDKQIEGGTKWDNEIKEELQNADIILLLVTPDFMASDYIWNVELKYAFENQNKLKKVIPLFLVDVDIEDTPISDLQGYISKDQTIASFPEREQDRAFLKIVKSIREDVKRLTMEK